MSSANPPSAGAVQAQPLIYDASLGGQGAVVIPITSASGLKQKFFTLDLYHRFNSPDVDEALRADADWEDAIVRYKKYLQTYRDELPPGAKKLAEEVNLHDAEVLGRRL